MSLSTPISKLANTSTSASIETSRAISQAEKRIAFRRARAQGLTIAASAKAAGISECTGIRWNKLAKRGALDIQADPRAIMGRDEALGIITGIARSPDVPEPVKLGALERLSRMQGFDAPARSIVEQRVVPASVIAWLDGLSQPVEPKQLTDSTSDNKCYVNPPAAAERAALDANGPPEPPKAIGVGADHPPSEISTKLSGQMLQVVDSKGGS